MEDDAIQYDIYDAISVPLRKTMLIYTIFLYVLRYFYLYFVSRFDLTKVALYPVEMWHSTRFSGLDTRVF